MDMDSFWYLQITNKWHDGCWNNSSGHHGNHVSGCNNNSFFASDRTQRDQMP